MQAWKIAGNVMSGDPDVVQHRPEPAVQPAVATDDGHLIAFAHTPNLTVAAPGRVTPAG
jgi:hypothetical protein